MVLASQAINSCPQLEAGGHVKSEMKFKWPPLDAYHVRVNYSYSRYPYGYLLVIIACTLRRYLLPDAFGGATRTTWRDAAAEARYLAGAALSVLVCTGRVETRPTNSASNLGDQG